MCHGQGDCEKCMQDFGWELEGNRPLGRLEQMKIGRLEIGWEIMNWIYLAQR